MDSRDRVRRVGDGADVAHHSRSDVDCISNARSALLVFPARHSTRDAQPRLRGAHGAPGGRGARAPSCARVRYGLERSRRGPCSFREATALLGLDVGRHLLLVARLVLDGRLDEGLLLLVGEAPPALAQQGGDLGDLALELGVCLEQLGAVGRGEREEGRLRALGGVGVLGLLVLLLLERCSSRGSRRGSARCAHHAGHSRACAEKRARLPPTHLLGLLHATRGLPHACARASQQLSARRQGTGRTPAPAQPPHGPRPPRVRRRRANSPSSSVKRTLSSSASFWYFCFCLSVIFFHSSATFYSARGGAFI